MIRTTKKFFIISLMCISALGGIYTFSKIGSIVIKSASHDMIHEHFTTLVTKGELTKTQGTQITKLVCEISDLYVDSLGIFAEDPTPRLEEIYASNKNFILSMLDRDLPVEKRKKILNEISEFKKYPTKEYLELPKSLQIFIDHILEDVEKEVALTV